MSQHVIVFIGLLAFASAFTESPLGEVNQITVPGWDEEQSELYKQLKTELFAMRQEYYAEGSIDGEILDSVAQEPVHKSQFTKTVEGLASAFAFTGLAELGDKTFLMVVIFTQKMNNVLLFWVVSLGLAVMHSLGALCGGVFQLFISQYWLNIASVVVFAIFGVALIYLGVTEEEDSADEKLKEVQDEINETLSHHSFEDEEAQEKVSPFIKCFYGALAHPGVKLFLMTLMSEMGDRSQITAIALATTYPVSLVIVGGILGHMLAMLLAIIAGKLISHSVKETTVTLIGGILFLLFSGYELIFQVLM